MTLTREQVGAMRMALLQQHELHPLTQSNIRALCDLALSAIEQQARIAELERELVLAKRDADHFYQYSQRLLDQVAELEKDAARYRWLREQRPNLTTWHAPLDAGQLDAAIDRAKGEG